MASVHDYAYDHPARAIYEAIQGQRYVIEEMRDMMRTAQSGEIASTHRVIKEAVRDGILEAMQQLTPEQTDFIGHVLRRRMP